MNAIIFFIEKFPYWQKCSCSLQKLFFSERGFGLCTGIMKERARNLDDNCKAVMEALKTRPGCMSLKCPAGCLHCKDVKYAREVLEEHGTTA